MSNLNTLRPRKDVRYTSTIAPTINDGSIIGETWQVTVAPYEKFTLVDIVSGFSKWYGTQGTVVDPLVEITSPVHSNLVAMYTMDNISGSTLVDESPNGNDGTISGAVAVAGKIGNALDFVDTDTRDQIETATPLVPLTGDWGITVWSKPDTKAHTDTQAIIGTYSTDISGQPGRWRLAYLPTTGDVHLFINGADASPQIATAGTDWDMIYIERSGGSVGISLNNGTLSTATMNIANSLMNRFNSIGGFWSTNEPANMFSPFNGLIDQLRIFNRALTAGERTALYNGGAGA